MTHDEKQPPEALVAADQPVSDQPSTHTPRRWHGLRLRDWTEIAGAGLLSLGLIAYIGARFPTLPRPVYLLLVIWAALLSCLLTYTTSRRLLAGVYEQVEAVMADARHINANTSSRLGQISDLIGEAERMTRTGTGEMTILAQKIAALQVEHAQVQAQHATLQRDLDTARSHGAPPAALDELDQRILALLKADPTLTDAQIGADAKMMLERSQVTRRRNRLAELGYPAAQKRQGQRPPAH